MPQPRIHRRIFLAGTVASATLASALGRARAQAPTAPDVAQRYDALIARFAAAHPGMVRGHRVLTLAGSARPWHDTNIDLRAGEHVSLVAAGQLILNAAAGLSVLPRVALWARVGEADVFRPGADTYSFRAANAGRLALAALAGGRWSTSKGELSPGFASGPIEGALDVLVIHWGSTDARRGFEALCAFAPDEPAFAEELRRLCAPVVLPRGFEPLWYVGSGESFHATTRDGAPAIAVRSEQSGGIIRAPLSLPLAPGLTIAWTWRMNQLPSQHPENAIPTHQYASIALELDDGQDLSWFWSASLAPDTHFRCPFPTWPGETHLVVRAGEAERGRWVDERRDVYADATRALPRRPAHVTGLWLLVSTLFGTRPASFDFRSIAVTDAEGTTHTLLPT